VYEWLRENVNYIDVTQLSVGAGQGIVHGWKIFVNGKWIGISPEADESEQSFDEAGKPKPVPEWVHMFREARKENIDTQVSISTYSNDRKEIYIFTDEGRFCRPLFVVDRKTKKLALTPEIVKKVKQFINPASPPGDGWSWKDLIENHIIEYIDVAESESPKIATYLKRVNETHTHCEIHPSMMLGLLASLISFPDHSQAPRNTYQCIWEEEPVLMADGSRKKIKDVKVGDNVVTFNPDNMKISVTKVVHAHTIPTDKKIVKVRTVSGRTITVTDDHLIMTSKGWVKAGDLTSDSCVAVSLEQDYVKYDTKSDVLLSVSDFEKNLKKKGIKDSLIVKHSEDLNSKGILPLTSNSKFVSVLARMYGFILADGSITVYKGESRLQADFGSEESANSFEDDVETLGYSRAKVSFSRTSYCDAVHDTYVIRHQTAFCSLLIALGYAPGKTSTQPYPDVHDWIKSSDMTKREFLAGMQGGDGCQIRWNKMNKRGFNFVCGDTLMTVRNEYVKSLRTFMTSVCKLYEDLKISSKVVEYPSKYDGSSQCGVRIKCSQDNLIKYYKTVGYRYDDRKIVNSGKIVEYLLFKKQIEHSHLELVEKIRNKIEKDTTASSISKEFSIKYKQASSILRSYRDCRDASMRNLEPDEMVSSWNIDHSSTTLFVPVTSVITQQNVMISDITTESDNHSFICGDNFCVHNSAMGKQALGIPTLNFNDRYDTTNYVLYYPQKPLVCTKMHDIIGTNKMPSTQTTIVAVLDMGYNQEDSIIMNQGWIDRGGGRSTLYKTYKAETKKHKILPDDKFERPNADETMGMKKSNYNKLGEDGIADVGTRVNKGDIIMGITGPAPTFSSFSRTRSYNKANTQRVATNINPKLTKKDRSVGIRMSGIVDSVMLTETGEQITMAKLRTRTIRIPKIGDKFAASSGQKGTVGMIHAVEDMPYTERDGIVPDIVMNPHAFPSRMTINQQIQMLMGKLCAVELKQGDSTPFQDNPDDENIVDKTAKELVKHGFQSKGEEIFIDGITGKKIKARVFVGPTDYQRLKHMVDDKKHSRSKGPHNQLTRQPVEGRMRDGGLRVGEMEKDTLVAHGVAMNLLELMMKKSDQFTLHICELCGLPSVAKTDRGIYYCTACNNMDHVFSVKCPYAFKLLFQELMGMLIVPRAELGSALDQ
jgi:DNA-directed RNA polymerase beta subunit